MNSIPKSSILRRKTEQTPTKSAQIGPGKHFFFSRFVSKPKMTPKKTLFGLRNQKNENSKIDTSSKFQSLQDKYDHVHLHLKRIKKDLSIRFSAKHAKKNRTLRKKFREKMSEIRSPEADHIRDFIPHPNKINGEKFHISFHELQERLLHRKRGRRMVKSMNPDQTKHQIFLKNLKRSKKTENANSAKKNKSSVTWRHKRAKSEVKPPWKAFKSRTDYLEADFNLKKFTSGREDYKAANHKKTAEVIKSFNKKKRAQSAVLKKRNFLKEAPTSVWRPVSTYGKQRKHKISHTYDYTAQRKQDYFEKDRIGFGKKGQVVTSSKPKCFSFVENHQFRRPKKKYYYVNNNFFDVKVRNKGHAEKVKEIMDQVNGDGVKWWKVKQSMLTGEKQGKEERGEIEKNE